MSPGHGFHFTHKITSHTRSPFIATPNRANTRLPRSTEISSSNGPCLFLHHLPLFLLPCLSLAQPALKESLLVMLVILGNNLFAHFFCRFHFLLDFIPLKDYNEHMHKPVSLCFYLISLKLNLLLVSLYPSQDVVCVCACVLAQSCPALRNLMDCIPPGSSIHGILQGRILEWVTMSFSRGSSRPRG